MSNKFSIIGVIIYLILNLIILFFLNPNKILYFLIFHIFIIFIIFCISIHITVNNKKRSDIVKNMDSSSKSSYLLANYIQNAGHVLFCYFGFFYLYLTVLIVLFWYRKIKMKPYIIIMTLTTGFILAFKETFLQFSQCVTAGFSSIELPQCDKHYYDFWNCIQNKTYKIPKVESEEE